MPSFDHDGVQIAFLDAGEGEPIVLVHGFGSNKEVNWVCRADQIRPASACRLPARLAPAARGRGARRN